MKNKIKTWKQLQDKVSHLQDQDKRVAFTNGCFDLLHVGHVRYLRQAKKLADFLVVAVNSDSSVKEFKGEDRPIINEDERMELLAALEMIDFVTVFSQLTCIELLKTIEPDIYVKGGDYTSETLPEWDTVKSFGGSIELVKEVKARSTSELVKEIRGERG
jgi:rfaE bifunctional protein nucleotidyltransferase chain/domain